MRGGSPLSAQDRSPWNGDFGRVGTAERACCPIRNILSTTADRPLEACAILICEIVDMDFEECEQLVLHVLFETEVSVTAAHIAYLGHVSVRNAERHLARLVEHGTLLVRAGSDGVVEYYYPGRKPIVRDAGTFNMGPPTITIGDPFLVSLRPRTSPVTSVLLSMLIPGAGHIYSAS